MSNKNKQYKSLQLCKATTLILLRLQKEGHDILKDIYNKEADTTEKQIYLQYMNMTRQDIINGKEVSVTTTAYH